MVVYYNVAILAAYTSRHMVTTLYYTVLYLAAYMVTVVYYTVSIIETKSNRNITVTLFLKYLLKRKLKFVLYI